MIACSDDMESVIKAASAERSQALVRIASEQGYEFWHARGMSYAGWVRAIEGAHADGLTMLTQALREFDAMGIWLSRPHTRAMRADVHARMGHLELALADIDGALAICVCTGETWPQAELHRRKVSCGVLIPKQRKSACNAHWRWLVRRAASFSNCALQSASHAWHENGRQAAAHDLLAPVYSWFTEGFDAADLIEARSLLDDATD